MKRSFIIAMAAFMLSAGAADAQKVVKKAKVSKSKKTAEVPALQLKSEADSIAYVFGVSQTQALRQYMKVQLGVDTANVQAFVTGVSERINSDSNDSDKAAYFQGIAVGQQIQQMTGSLSREYYSSDATQNLDAKIVAQGIIDGLLGKNTVSVDSAGMMFQERLSARQAANREAMYGPNRIAGEKFLEENKKKEGVITLPSGLQYKVLVQGDGAVPTATQKVKVNYEGHLIDGTEFDSSYKRNEPTTFQCNQVIKGWTEALCLMPVGSKWELYIPYQLAYGERDAGQIKPYSALIFTVELLSIEDPAAAQPEAGKQGKAAKSAKSKKK